MSTYYNNIPQGADNPSDSQPLLLSNFQAIFNAQNRNHVSFTDTANSGRHVVIEMQEQASDPTPVATYASLYVKDDAGTQNLYMIDESSIIYKLTNDFTAATDGTLTIPGGLTFKWGQKFGLASGTAVTFPVAFTSTCYQVQLTGLQFNTSNVNRSYMVQKIGSTPTVSATGFTFRTDESTANSSFFYFAIGV